MRTKSASPPDLPEIDPSGITNLNRIPVIDKMMKIIGAIEAADAAGLSVGEVTDQTHIPRSTVYRVLNTLSDHGMLLRLPTGNYALGFRLVSLASRVRTELGAAELAEIVAPFLAQIAEQTGETCKFSVLADDRAVVRALVQSTNPMAPSSSVGSAFDLHAGAASKVLLSFAPKDVRRRVLTSALRAYTPKTITHRPALEAELETVRSEAFGTDRGEWNINVNAVAVPVFAAGGKIVGALSITFFAAADFDVMARRIGEPLKIVGGQLSASLGYSPVKAVEVC